MYNACTPDSLDTEDSALRTLRNALTALGTVVLLAGCPGVPGLSGTPTLEPKVLAVTSSDEDGITTALVNLSWPGVTNAATYQITRKVGDGTSRLRTTLEKTEYTDTVNPNLTLTYVVQAFGANGEEMTSSSPKTVQVLNATVGKPSNLAVDKKVAAADTAVTPNSSKPELSWDEGAGATSYYVRVNEVGDGAKSGKVVYSAITKTTSAVIGTLSQPELNIPGYTQIKGDGLVKGKNYYFSVTSIRADVADLSKATAFDVKMGDAPAKISFF